MCEFRDKPLSKQNMVDPDSHTSVVHSIQRKRDGKILSQDALKQFVCGILNGEISEAQIGAMLMAIYMNGMTDEETRHLTKAMIQTGDRLSHPEAWRGSVVGKHSTGGVGDKVSLVLVPALAACGLKVPKISGRGLGYTGGTLDKLESVPGFRVTGTPNDIRRYVDDAGCCLVAQTNSLVPADKIMYAIRDTTATVESIPLIVGSIMSKKAAEGLDALVLELTYGRAAPMKTEAQARQLACAMIDTGHSMQLKTTAFLTRMDHPLGKMIGNTLEVLEAVECLNGGGSTDLIDIVCQLGGHLLHSVGRVSSVVKGQKLIQKTLHDGTAMAKFSAMLVAQGVDSDLATLLTEVVDCHDMNDPILPVSNYTTELICFHNGYVTNIEGIVLAEVLRQLGACRERPNDVINLAVGLELFVQVDDYIQQGAAWVRVHHDYPLSEQLRVQIQSALEISDNPLSSSVLTRISDIIV